MVWIHFEVPKRPFHLLKTIECINCFFLMSARYVFNKDTFEKIVL